MLYIILLWTLTRHKLYSIFIIYYMRKEDKVTLTARERPKRTSIYDISVIIIILFSATIYNILKY